MRIGEQQNALPNTAAHAQHRRWSAVAFSGILVLALTLRLAGITWGLPNDADERYLPWTADESTFVSQVARMNPAQLDFNPYKGPFKMGIGSFTAYSLAAGLGTAAVLGVLELHSSKSYYIEHLDERGKMFLIGRLLSVAFALASVIVFYLVVRHMYGTQAGWVPLMAALLLATMPGHVLWSHYLTQNLPVTFWVLVTFYFLLRLVERGQIKYYVLAGLSAGLGISTNYNAAPLVGLLILAHALVGGRWRDWRGWLATARLGRLALAGLLVVVGFALATPYAFLRPDTFVVGFTAQLHAVSGGQYISLLDSVGNLFVDLFPAGLGWGLFLLAIGGCLWLALKRRWSAGEMLLGAWLAVWGLVAVRAGGTAGVGRLLPFLVTLVVPAVGWLGALWASGGRRRWLAGMLAVLVSLMTLADALWLDAYFVSDNVRAEASRWIRTHVPAGTEVGLCIDPWYFSPDVIGTEFYQPSVTDHPYRFQVYDYSAPALTESPAPYIVFATQELEKRFAESSEPTKEAFRAWLREHYDVVATFQTNMPWWGLFRTGIPSGIWASPDIVVLKLADR